MKVKLSEEESGYLLDNSFNLGNINGVGTMFEEYTTNNNNSSDCPDMEGQIIKINIPPGFTIKLLGLLELTPPGGICLILRSPLFSGANTSLESIIDAVKKSGATVHFEQY